MAKLTGGMKVDEGYYWNADNWETEAIPEGGGQLQGPPEANYLKLPLLVAVPVSAMVGATFLMSLPVIGLVVFVKGLGKAIFSKHASSPAPGPAKHGGEGARLE